MATLASLLRGERGAIEEAGRLGLLVAREGLETVELRDVDSRVVLGFLSTRQGIVLYHVDSTTPSFELVLLEDSSVLERVELGDIVEDGVPRPPSVWLHEATGSSTPPGRICFVEAGRAKCKPL